ncbi:MAG: hypothetical protein GAK29_00199 [Acinetobacter bereziniae]|uniref:Uncharacterized protein n=1 Tax=Acinetobacter bereziniae TaxID=106648 RepID=A0A833PLG1_ACIBZ|nr:MAG: hypothetical protein GAK29_00199 [Acinetobacter bereziniae]
MPLNPLCNKAASNYALVKDKYIQPYWDMDILIYDFKKIDIFNHIILDLPNSYPIYLIDPEIMVNFNKKLAKIDIYMP